jgi:hypothetical protein
VGAARIDLRVRLEKDKLTGAAGFVMPLHIQSAGNKVIIAYEDSKLLSLLQFSAFNPGNHKLILLK